MAFKKGVSTWSYLPLAASGKMSVEDMLAAMSAAGGKGVEILPAMHKFFDYPNYTAEDIERWKGWMAKYDLEPVSNSSCIICVKGDKEPKYLPKGVEVHRNPSHEEMVQLMKNEIDMTADFGFNILRHPVLNGMSFEAIEDSLKYAEDKGIGLDLEIHTPFSLKGPEVEKQVEMIERNNAKLAGIIPDLNAFQDKLPAILRTTVLAEGAEEEILSYIDEALVAHEDMEKVFSDVKSKTNNTATLRYAEAASELIPNTLDDLKPLAKYINHFHAKFFDINDQGVETVFDYKKYMQFLKDIGYEGWLISEYEGFFHHPTQGTESIEQVQRHIKLMEEIDSQL